MATPNNETPVARAAADAAVAADAVTTPRVVPPDAAAAAAAAVTAVTAETAAVVVAVMLVCSTPARARVMTTQVKQLGLDVAPWSVHCVPALTPLDGVRGGFLPAASVGHKGDYVAMLPHGWTPAEAMRAVSHLWALKQGAAVQGATHVLVVEDVTSLHYLLRQTLETALRDAAAAAAAVPQLLGWGWDSKEQRPNAMVAHVASTAVATAVVARCLRPTLGEMLHAAAAAAAASSSSGGSSSSSSSGNTVAALLLGGAAPLPSSPLLLQLNEPLAVPRPLPTDAQPHPWRSAAALAEVALGSALRAALMPAADGKSFPQLHPGHYWRQPHWGLPQVVHALRATKRIAVMMHDQNAFNNGCMQNGYFLVKAFRALGYGCDMVAETPDDDTTTQRIPFAKGLLGDSECILPLRANDRAALMRYGTVVYSTRIPTEHLADAMAAHGVARISFKCGNTYMLDVEELVSAGDNPRRGYGPMQDAYHARVSDEMWTVGLLMHAKQYYETVTRLRVYEIPHLWDTDFCDAAYREQLRLPPLPSDAARGRSGVPTPRPYWSPTLRLTPREAPIDLVSLEPHLSTVKHSLLIMTIAQALYDRNPKLLGTLYLYSWPFTKAAETILDGFPALKLRGPDGQRLHAKPMHRERSTAIYHRFANARNPMAFVGTWYYNDSNYVATEQGELGFPIVHNSKAYGRCADESMRFGTYFQADDELFDIQGAVDAVITAATEHPHRYKEQRARAARYMAVHNDPASPQVLEVMQTMIDGSLDRVAAARETQWATDEEGRKE